MKKKKKIIQIIQHFHPGGLENMALSLQSQENDNIIISLESNYAEALKKWKSISSDYGQIMFLDKKKGISLKVFLKLCRIILKEKPDVVHTHHIGPLFYGGLSALFCGFKNIIHTEHDAWYLNNKKTLKLQSILLKLIKPKVVAVSSLVAEEIKKKIPFSNPLIVKNGIDTEKFKPFSRSLSRKMLNLPTDKIIIGCAGRLVDVKGHIYLIESLKDLNDDICVAIAGNGELREYLIQKSIEYGVKERVHFLDHVNNMPLFYNALNIFCLPSLSEGLPLALLEAQACNIPCIASDVGSIKEIISGNSGILVKAASVKELKHAVRNVLQAIDYFSPREEIVNFSDLRTMVKSYQEIYSVT